MSHATSSLFSPVIHFFGLFASYDLGSPLEYEAFFFEPLRIVFFAELISVRVTFPCRFFSLISDASCDCGVFLEDVSYCRSGILFP